MRFRLPGFGYRVWQSDPDPPRQTRIGVSQYFPYVGVSYIGVHIGPPHLEKLPSNLLYLSL